MASPSTGPVHKLRTYFQDVIAELGKCSWPTMPELVQSTLVVVFSFLILGAAVFLYDMILRFVIQNIL